MATPETETDIETTITTSDTADETPSGATTDAASDTSGCASSVGLWAVLLTAAAALPVTIRQTVRRRKY